MTLDTDFHSHVSYTSAHEMAQSAHEKGLRILGLSEHVTQMREARLSLEYLGQEGPLLTFAEYIEAVRTADQRLSIDVRLGLEVDFIPEKNEYIQAAIQPYDWDFLIGSVHEVDGYIFERPNHLMREEGEHYWLRYLQLLRDAVCSGYFSLVSHPVRMRVFNPHLPPMLDEELERLAAEAARCNVALEINGSDMLGYPDLVRRLALACASQQTPISVGSDAHRPPEVAQAHRQSAKLLREVGISTVRVWKQRVAEEYSIA
jgi:histidinol-phosphatase (PHP family)